MLVEIYQCMYCQKAALRKEGMTCFQPDDFVEENELGLEYVNLRFWVICPLCKLLMEGG